MSGDAVKRALEAALDASILHDGEDQPPPLAYRNLRRFRVAHEIAAFLRALPDLDGLPHPADLNRRIGVGKHRTMALAAAVTQAAQEGSGDGE